MGSTFRPIEYESMYTSRFIEDCFEVFKHAWNSLYFKPILIWKNFSSTLLLSIYVLELIDNKSFLHHFKQEIKILTINYFFFFFLVHKCTTGNKCNNFIKILHEVHKVQLLQTDQGDNSGTLWWHDPYSLCDFLWGHLVHVGTLQWLDLHFGLLHQVIVETCVKIISRTIKKSIYTDAFLVLALRIANCFSPWLDLENEIILWKQGRELQPSLFVKENCDGNATEAIVS